MGWRQPGPRPLFQIFLPILTLGIDVMRAIFGEGGFIAARFSEKAAVSMRVPAPEPVLGLSLTARLGVTDYERLCDYAGPCSIIRG